MTSGLGRRQRLFIDALRRLEAQHGSEAFYLWAIVNEVAQKEIGADASSLANAARVVTLLESRGLIERTGKHGVRSAVKLTDAGRATCICLPIARARRNTDM